MDNTMIPSNIFDAINQKKIRNENFRFMNDSSILKRIEFIFSEWII